MTGSTATDVPACPFCGAAWTGDMLTLLDQFTVPGGCACCAGAPSHPVAPIARPTEDICCAACGRAIYRALAAR